MLTVRFRPEPSPRPTSTPLNYSPEVDNPPSIDHSPENRLQPSISTSNQRLINRTTPTQRADNPPPPPFIDPLSTKERLDDKRMQTITRRDLLFKFMVHVTNELINDPRPTLHSKDFDAVTVKKRFEALEKALNSDRLNSLQEKNNTANFNARIEEYKAALIQAQEVEVQATQKGDKTIIPTSKILKLETRREPLNETIPQVTGNIHLDKHLARTSVTEKPANKKDKATKKKLLPLDSSIGDLSISSFTTEPYFEDLEPTLDLPNLVLKKITPKRALPVISDSESKEDISIDHPSSPVLKKIACKPELPILSDSEDELDEGPIIPTLNPSTLIQNDEPSKLDEPIKVLKTPKGTTKHPGSLGIIREPLSSDESRASSEMESESKDKIPEAEIIRILIKKQVKIHARYLKAISNKDKKTILDQAQQNQLILQKLIPNKEIESYVNGWNPWVEKKKVFPAPPKNKKRPKFDKRNQPRQSGSNRPDRTHSNYNRDPTRSTNSRIQNHSNTSRNQGRPNNNPRQTHSNHQGNDKHQGEESEDLEDEVRWRKVHRATAVLGAFFRHTKSSKLLRVVEKCYVKTAKTLSEISDQLSDPLPVQMGPLEKSLVYHLKKEIDKVSILVKDIHGTSNPEGIESLTTQIKYLHISADIMEKLEQSEASILSNVKQDLITEVRVYVQKEVETLTTTVTTSFEGIMSQLRNMEQNSNDKFNNLQRDIVTAAKIAPNLKRKSWK
ncbi:hypothetical protein H4Q26_009516 [Puccinia striiformis f. sp. tritici PST-130]|nr:hypothetical protein H4Q26_009516 [Puccinia striiformis f. sp. tritici PST-130]